MRHIDLNMTTYYCHHAKKHKIILKSEEDLLMDRLIKEWGWYDSGYCFAYLPKWLRKELRKSSRKIIKEFRESILN